jgi:hypothetical protein
MHTVGVSRRWTANDLRREFERQVETLIQKGNPAIAGVTEADFLRNVAPLGERIGELAAIAVETPEGRIPFVIVVPAVRLAGERAVSPLELGGKGGFTDMRAEDLARFAPIAGVEVPDGAAYLLLDVETGRDTLNVTPDDALATITAQGRSPLTVDEGIALVTHYPEVLKQQNCFSMLGSRCGDRRVTALWVSRGRPRLGWCWAGNPHTWLGSASCGGRLGAPASDAPGPV